MSLLAKTVVKNKCWIVEQDGLKIGSIFSDTDGVTLIRGKLRERFSSLRALSDQFDLILDKPDFTKLKPESHNVHGFPCEYKAHNGVWDLRHKLPIFTTSAKSKSFFCAGYYIVKLNNGWVDSYCPKLITLTRYPYHGPYKTQEERNIQLQLENGAHDES